MITRTSVLKEPLMIDWNAMCKVSFFIDVVKNY